MSHKKIFAVSPSVCDEENDALSHKKIFAVSPSVRDDDYILGLLGACDDLLNPHPGTESTVSSSEDDDDHCLGANDDLSNPHPGTESMGEEKKGEKGVALSTRDLEEFEARLGEDPIQRKRELLTFLKPNNFSFSDVEQEPDWLNESEDTMLATFQSRFLSGALTTEEMNCLTTKSSVPFCPQSMKKVHVIAGE